MSTPPPDVQTVSAEGADLRSAVAIAANELGVPNTGVQWSIDKSWFRNEAGGMIPRDTVRIIAWARNLEELEAAVDAEKWMKGLLDRMDFENTVSGEINGDGVVVLRVQVDKPSRLVGRHGKTLGAIRHLLLQCVGADFPERDFRIEVPDNREREDRGRDDRGRDDRGRDDRGRDDRGRDDRGARGRDRDRDGDRRGRGRDRDRDRGDRGDRGDRRRTNEKDAARLRRMAMKIAERVAETGEAEVIRKELNGFDRRIVHLAISEMSGVNTRSIGDGNLKQIEIFADPDSVAVSGEE